MAYEYMDPMGNYTGYEETDEERRKRLAAEATPVTQTIKTNPVTGEQEMTVKGTPADLSAANPLTPTVVSAVSPDQVFQRQIQAESGGQHIDPRTGQILTSPKGAQGRAQIMPATAAQPGYGIQPATPAEVASPEGNTAFGQRYKEGMLKLFGGDQQKATAAYNAGPGAVKRAEQQAQASGGSWTDYIPKETMNYLGKVFGSIIPSAQAGELTPQQRAGAPTVTPQAVAAPAPAPAPAPAATGQEPAPSAPVSPYALSTGQGAPGLKVPGVMPTPAGQMPQQQAQADFQTIQDDPAKLMNFGLRDDVPDYLKQRASDRAYELLKLQRDEQVYRQKFAEAAQSDPASLARKMNSKTEEGSWFKMIMLGFVSPQLAGQEAVKLGLAPTKWEDSTYTDESGKEVGVQLQRRADGKIMSGTFADGRALTPAELEAAQAGALGKGVHVTKTETYVDPASGQVVTHQTLSNAKERFTMGGKSLPADFDRSKLVPEKQFTAAEDRRVQTAVENLRKNVPQPTEQQTLQALIAARVPNRRIEQEMGYAPGTLGAGTGRQGAGAQPPAATAPVAPAATAPVAPSAVAPVAPARITPSTTAQNATPAQQQTALAMADQPPAQPVIRDIRPGERKDQYDAYVKQQNEAYQKRLEEYNSAQKLKQKDADEFSKKRFEVQSTLNKFREGIDIIDQNKHNLGPNFTLSGSGPLPKVQQFFGEQFGTDDSANTALLRSLITRGGLEGIKNYMGPAISNFDVQTWMKNNPISESSPPAAIKAWLAKTHNAMLDAAEAQRLNAVKQGFVEPSFNLGNRIESGGAQSASPADKARAEQERRRRGQ